MARISISSRLSRLNDIGGSKNRFNSDIVTEESDPGIYEIAEHGRYLWCVITHYSSKVDSQLPISKFW